MHADQIWDFVRALQPNVVLAGTPTLVVGDSMVSEWPWPGDRVALPGYSIPMIQELIADKLAQQNHRYERAMVWAGTAHLAGGLSAASYTNGMVDLVDALRPFADGIVVLGPMPYDEVQFARFTDRLLPLPGRMKEDTVATTADIVAQMRERLPDTIVFDLSPLRAAALAQGQMATLYVDGIHLTPSGFALLRRQLADAGIPLPEAQIPNAATTTGAAQSVPAP